jgi:hypothetical protein
MLAVVSTSAVAQHVWIVDNVNAAGAHFPDLPQALGSPLVVHGDVLLLRGPGPYQTAATSKGVSIVAPGSAIIGQPGNPNTALTVSSLPSGTHFSLRNVVLAGLPRATALILSACAGSVHLDHVTIVLNGAPVQNAGYAGFQCTGCSAVTVQGCHIEGKPAIQSITSSISVTSSTLVGIDAGPGDMYTSPSAAGLLANGSNVAIACSSVTGGSGAGDGLFNPRQPGSPAVSASGGSLAIGGNASTSSFTAGMPVTTELIPAVGLTGMVAGSVAIDPRVPMTARNGAPVIQGAPANSVHTVASLGATRTVPNLVSVKVIRRQSDIVALLVGMPVPPMNGPFGRVWLDAGIRAWVAGGVIDASETWNQTMLVPNTPVLFGLPLGLQAAVLSATAAEVTNPAVVVVGV